MTRPETVLEGLFACPDCGKKRWVTGRSAGIKDGHHPGRGRNCGCAGKDGLRQLRAGGFLGTSGPSSPNWTGGRSVRSDGYVLVHVAPDHPFARMGRKKGRVCGWSQIFEHRLKMAEKLGRPLLRREHVHHRDGNPSNNDIDNLMLMSSAAEHVRFEHQQRQKRLADLETENAQLRKENERLKCLLQSVR